MFKYYPDTSLFTEKQHHIVLRTGFVGIFIGEPIFEAEPEHFGSQIRHS